MADNVTANPGAGGATFAADDIGGVHYPRTKISIGADGAAADVHAGNPMPVKELRPSTSVVGATTASTASVTLIASNANRLCAVIYNDSTATLFIKLGATASTSSFTVKLSGGDYYEVPLYTGIVDGIWSAVNGSARTTELTA